MIQTKQLGINWKDAMKLNHQIVRPAGIGNFVAVAPDGTRAICIWNSHDAAESMVAQVQLSLRSVRQEK